MSEPSPARVSTPALAAIAITCALAAGLIAYATSPLGLMFALGAGSFALLLFGAGASLAWHGQRLFGASVILLGVMLGCCCGGSGLGGGWVQGLIPESAALEPIATEGAPYLRHPSGFVLAEPAGMVESPTVATALGLTINALGTSLGAWGWQNDDGEILFVGLVRHRDEPGARRMEGFARGLVSERPSAPTTDVLVRWAEASPDLAPPTGAEAPARTEGWARREVWARGQRRQGARLMFMEVRVITWRGPEGWQTLVASAAHLPERSYELWLRTVHAPDQPWRGPGSPPTGIEREALSLAEARARVPVAVETDVTLEGEITASEGFELTEIASPAGALRALTTPVGAVRASAALCLNPWADGELAAGPNARRLAEAGVVVMIPALRGERGNPGRIELLGGEVDDARAALDHLRARADVDPSRIYVIGLGAGATLALLLAETGAEARGYLAIEPLAEAYPLSLMDPMRSADGVPIVDSRDTDQLWIRSPIHFLAGLRSPTHVLSVLGRRDAELLRESAPAGSPLRVELRSGDVESVTGEVIDQVLPQIRAGAPLDLGGASP